MFERIPDYYKDARSHEAVFRAILRDVKTRVNWVPNELNPEAELEEILRTYSEGNRYGIFTITDFKRGPDNVPLLTLKHNEARIGIKDVATLSGPEAILKYEVLDDKVKYVGPLFSAIH